MIIGWGLCIPSGVAWAFKGKHLDPLWFNVHRVLVLSGLAVAFIAWVVAFSMFEGSYPHGAFGYVIMFAAFLQPINAFFRRHKGEGTWRTVWEHVHAWYGRLLILLALVELCLGVALLQFLQPTDNAMVSFGVPLALALIFR